VSKWGRINIGKIGPPRWLSCSPPLAIIFRFCWTYAIAQTVNSETESHRPPLPVRIPNPLPRPLPQRPFPRCQTRLFRDTDKFLTSTRTGHFFPTRDQSRRFGKSLRYSSESRHAEIPQEFGEYGCLSLTVLDFIEPDDLLRQSKNAKVRRLSLV
jgi:hypothetical protein